MLRRFTPSDFSLLSTWVNSEKLLLQFSATTFSYPLNYPDMEKYLALNPGRQFYMVNDDKFGDYGFGEVISQTDNVPRLGRLLIGDPQLRGKGLGKKMISHLLAECRNNYAATGTELYVLIDNLQAIRCYKSLGFDFIGDDIEIDLKYGFKTIRKMRLDF